MTKREREGGRGDCLYNSAPSRTTKSISEEAVTVVVGVAAILQYFRHLEY